MQHLNIKRSDKQSWRETVTVVETAVTLVGLFIIVGVLLGTLISLYK